MSMVQSALGTLLVQRLDAVLGTTMAQHAELVARTRTNAVTQAGPAPSTDATDTSTVRDPRHSVERARQQLARDPRGAVKDARVETALALAARGRLVSTESTASAPTSLGPAARIILALLARFPEPAPPAQGRQPLWTPPGHHPAAARADTGQAAGAQAARSHPLAGASGQAASLGPAAARSHVPAAGAAAHAAGPAAGPTPAPVLLARALASALDASGMFYESHLAGLAFGKRTAGQLANEPQARLAAGDPGQPPRAASVSQQASPSASHPTGADSEANPPATGASAGAASQPTPAPAGQPGWHGLAGAGLHPDAALLVRQQLEVLANQVFAWRGEAWPGAPMWWEVGRDGGQAAAGDAEIPAWATRLTLTLPRLGEVRAAISLAGNRLVMRLAAPDSADVLQEHAGELRERYGAAGFALEQLSVSDDRPGQP